jgi:hypothetical protein
MGTRRPMLAVVLLLGSESHCTAQAGLELKVLLLSPSLCWGHRRGHHAQLSARLLNTEKTLQCEPPLCHQLAALSCRPLPSVYGDSTSVFFLCCWAVHSPCASSLSVALVNKSSCCRVLLVPATQGKVRRAPG